MSNFFRHLLFLGILAMGSARAVAAVPAITSATSVTTQVGASFSYQITASNTPTSFNATGLPAGLTVNTTSGLISGTPTTAATSTVTLSATNASGTGTKALTLKVNPATPVISSASTASGQVGIAFTYQIVASNTPTSYSATGLPAGLSTSSTTGAISGKPTTAGTYTATIKATNAGGTGSATLTVTVIPAVPVISSAATATGQVGVAFTYQIAASNAPTSFNATGLPAGLAVGTSSGAITGTPTASGTSTVTLSATNAGGTGTKTLTVTINPPAPVISSATSASGQVGVAFTYQITASNSPTSYSATGLPAGLTVSTTTGAISGKPTTAGSYSATINAKNAGGTGSASLAISVLPAIPVINSATSTTGQVGVAFTYQITATNTPTSFNATGLPAGLTINTTTGAITGTPTIAATSTVTLSATNAGGTGTKSLSLKVNPDFPVINSATSATGQVGVAFTYQITATFNPTSYAATGLPAGLTINTTSGLISGTPTTAGTKTVALSAKNALGTGTANLALTIAPPTPVISSATTSIGQVGVAYNYQITASNTPTSYGAAGLPAGLSVSAMTGLVSGTPTTAGANTVTLSAANSGGTGTASLSLTINPPIPVIGGTSGTTGQVGSAFSYQITATNNPTSYGATGLPAGLSINTSTGLISGTPTTPGTKVVTITATNAGGTVTSTITLTILASLPYVTDFEAGQGFAAGSLNNQLGWVVTQGTANVTTADFSLGAQAVQLLASTPPATISQAFASSVGETIEFFDFFAKPVAETDPTQATIFQVEGAKFAFSLSTGAGQLQFVSGNGTGGGTWTPTTFTVPLGTSNQATSWVRLTARLDFTKQTWDLYANAQMLAADIPLINNTSTYLSAFQMQGDAVGASGLDDIYAGPTNPLFADVNNNGIDDAWETAHGLSLSSNNRNSSPSGNGVTVIQAYIGGTNPSDFYNGATPSLTIISGNNQTAAPGQFNAQPFDVGVWNTAGTAPLVNAPVTFTVQSGGGLLAATNGGTPTLTNSLSLFTDANGTAQAYYQQPNTASTPSSISLSAGNGQLTFSTASTAALSGDPSTISGLRLWLKGDVGITADSSGKVSIWADQSGLGNNAVETGSLYQPSVVLNSVNGHAVVHMDGNNHFLELPATFSGASAVEGFIVLKSALDNDPNNRGLWIVGTASGGYYPNQNNGHVLDDFGSTTNTDLGDPIAPLTDFNIYNPSSAPGIWEGRLNGALLARSTNNVVGLNSGTYLGRGSGGIFAGDIAEVIFYDHKLTDAQRDGIGAYLTAKYNPPGITVPAAPTSLNAFAVSAGQVSLTWGGDISATAGTVYTIERATGAGSFAVIGELDGLSYVDTGLAPATAYNYRVKARTYAGISTYSSIVAITTLSSGATDMPLANARLWLKADVGINGTDRVVRWLDQSGHSMDAVQLNSAYQPVRVANQLNGRPVVHFDGNNKYSTLPDFMSGATAGEAFLVLRSSLDIDSNNRGLWTMGIADGGYYPVQNNGHLADDFGSNQGHDIGHPVAPLSGFNIYNPSSAPSKWEGRLNGALLYRTASNSVAFNSGTYLGQGSGGYFSGDIAEVIVFDQALTDAQRDAVGSYLAAKYNPTSITVPNAPSNLTAFVMSSGQVSLNWTGDTASSSGVVYTVERQTGTGAFAKVADVSGLSYVDNGLTPQVTYNYRVKARSYAGSSAYSSTTSATTIYVGAATALPQTGMRLWLKADAGITGTDRVVRWQDQSGNGADAVQLKDSFQPLRVDNQLGGRPVVRFDGIDDYFNLPDFMNGATAGEVYVVLKAAQDMDTANRGLWLMGASGQGGYYPFQGTGNINDDFGSTTPHVVGNPVPSLATFNLYNASSQPGQWTAHFDGVQILLQPSNTVSFNPAPVLGVGSGGNFSGDIAEILVYDHVLSDTEREAVGAYLNSKYAFVPPNTFDFYRDQNQDGIADGVGRQRGIDSANMDDDNDGIPNFQELLNGTDPTKADTDGDGVPDGQDAFPLDPTRWLPPTPTPGDTTPPVITLTKPVDAVPLP